MNQQLISQIEELGLSNKEARVYIACLSIGPSPVQRIADQAEIKRVTTYVILESLAGLGLVSQSIKGKKTYFVAEDPRNLNRLLEKRNRELHEQMQNFEQILPQLQGLKAVPKEMPEVKFYEGKDGTLSLFSNFFANYEGSSHEIYAIGNLDQLHNFLPERVAKPNPDRVKHGIKSHIIYTSELGPIYKNSDKESERVSRYLPKEQYPLRGDFSILGDYVIMISYAEDRPIGITIRNSDMARGMKAIFDVCWELAGQHPANQDD